MVAPSDMTCVDLLKSMYDAIMGLGQGQQVQRIRFADREVQYTQASIAQLVRLYQTQYNLCGDESGLPDLSELQAQRGRPLRVTYAEE